MVDIERKDLALMMECGYILVGMQRFAEARQVFEGVAALAPDSEIPVVAIGSVAFCEGKFRDAVKQYQKAIKQNPQSPFARAYLGEALFFSGDTDEAVRALTAVSHDDTGKAGDFARALLAAISQGFTPEVLSGVDELQQLQQQRGDAT